MRVITLKIGDQHIDLHPSVTVLSGLGPAQQNYVVASLARMLNGDGNAVAGQFECHELIAEITPENVAALGLPDDSAVTVRAEELPGSSLGEYEPAFEARITELRAQLDAAYNESNLLGLRQQEAREVTQSATIELEAALSQLDTGAPAALTVAQERLDELITAKEEQAHDYLFASDDGAGANEEALAQLGEEAAALNVALEEERLVLLERFEELEAKESHLAELRLDLEAAAVSAETAQLEPTSDQFTPDEEVELEESEEVGEPEGLDDEDEPDPYDGLDEAQAAELTNLVEAVANHQTTIELIPHPEAAALADELEHLGRKEAKLHIELKAEGLDLGEFDAKITQLRNEIEVLERQAHRREVSAELEEQIERLYEALDETEGRRFGRRSKRSSHDVRQELDGALAEAGFPTYAAYVMGKVAPTVNQAALSRLVSTQEHLAEVIAQRQTVALLIDDDPRIRSLSATLNQLRVEGLGLLPGLQSSDSAAEVDNEELQIALRELRVEAQPNEIEETPLGRLGQRLLELEIITTEDEEATWVARAKDTIDAAHLHAEERARQAIHALELEEEIAGEDDASELGIDEVADEVVVNDQTAHYVELTSQIAALEDEIKQFRSLIIEADNELVAKEERHDQLNEQMARLAKEVAEHVPPSDPVAGLVMIDWPDDPNIAQANDTLKFAERRVQLHEAAKEALQQAEDKLQQARRAESMNLTVKRSADQKLHDLQRELDEVLERAPLPNVTWVEDPKLIGEIEWYLLAKVSALRKASFVGSIPLVLNDAFRSLSEKTISQLGTALIKVAETSQIIYVGNSPEMVAWAEAQPIEVATLASVSDPNG